MINLIYTLMPIITFMIGFSFGFSIKRDNKLPEIKTPAKIIQEHKEEKKQEQDRRVLEQYIENIDNYPYNQKDIKE